MGSTTDAFGIDDLDAIANLRDHLCRGVLGRAGVATADLNPPIREAAERAGR